MIVVRVTTGARLGAALGCCATLAGMVVAITRGDLPWPGLPLLAPAAALLGAAASWRPRSTLRAAREIDRAAVAVRGGGQHHDRVATAIALLAAQDESGADTAAPGGARPAFVRMAVAQALSWIEGVDPSRLPRLRWWPRLLAAAVLVIGALGAHAGARWLHRAMHGALSVAAATPAGDANAPESGAGGDRGHAGPRDARTQRANDHPASTASTPPGPSTGPASRGVHTVRPASDEALRATEASGSTPDEASLDDPDTKMKTDDKTSAPAETFAHDAPAAAATISGRDARGQGDLGSTERLLERLRRHDPAAADRPTEDPPPSARHDQQRVATDDEEPGPSAAHAHAKRDERASGAKERHDRGDVATASPAPAAAERAPHVTRGEPQARGAEDATGDGPGAPADDGPDIDTTGRPREVRLPEGAGPLRARAIEAAARDGFVHTDYAAVFRDYAEAALAALDREAIPGHRRALVARYFELVRPVRP